MTHFKLSLLTFFMLTATLFSADNQRPPVVSLSKPNILFLISDDQSWIHTGMAGCKGVKTPNFDKVAKQGIYFRNAFCSSPGCAPSRGAILSGQDFWRLKEGAVQRSVFPASVVSYPEILEANGYHVGVQGKGWGPGGLLKDKNNADKRPSWRWNSLEGKPHKSFSAFLKDLPDDKPFCFWFGSYDPHRPYVPGSGLKAGKKLEDVEVPPCMPDVPEVRSDILDYFYEIDRFDRDVGEILDLLDKTGRADNTLVFVTSDNGMPFPRCKTTLYDYGVRVPLAIRWPTRIKGGRNVDDFISLADCCPTILQAAGLKPLPEMCANSFMDVLLSEKSGQVNPQRNYALFGRERHGWSYPSRGIQNDRYLYIRNYMPERFEGLESHDKSPSKSFVLNHKDDPQYRKYYDYMLGRRPAEELYDLSNDPYQLNNLSSAPEQSPTLEKLRKQLAEELKHRDDPRVLSRGSEFDSYPGTKPRPAKTSIPTKQETGKKKTPPISPAKETTPAIRSSGKFDCDVAIIGGGSGGFGAALAAIRQGCKVVLVEKSGSLGGTSVNSGVNCWEMGAGGTGIPFDLYRWLLKTPNAAGIYSFGRHASSYNPNKEKFRYPGGEAVIDAKMSYLNTLQRHVPPGEKMSWGFRKRVWHGVTFEPKAMSDTMMAILKHRGRCRILLNTAFVSAEAADGMVKSIKLSNGETLRAKYYIDSTGGGYLCEAAGCETMFGQESKDEFNEPHAPDQATEHINGVSLIYRVTSVKEPAIEPLKEGIPAKCWWKKGFPSARVNHYPNGDLNINMLPTMEGGEFMKLGYEKAYKECERRIQAHWHSWQSRFDEFRGYRISWIAPKLGIRETQRIRGEYVLNENDLLAGLSGQKHQDIICIADHSFDSHGGHAKHGGELKQPYGVPYRCLIPKGFKNLLIASRGSSFSSIAASSCRLSRTMMQLGQAAGTAAGLAMKSNSDVASIAAEKLRSELRTQHVQLEHPMPEGLRKHLRRTPNKAKR